MIISKMSFMLKNFKLFVATCLLFIIAPSDSCELAANSENAAAVHPPVSGGYSTYSCTPCTPGAYEVHVINIYEPAGTNRGFRETIDYAPVPLMINSNKAVDVKLVLISYETADWEITKSSNVNILEVLVASYNDRYSSASLKSSSSTLKVQKERKYFSGWRQIREVNDYVTGKFGHISTFTAVYEASSWNLTVGTCDNSKITTMNPDSVSYQVCLEPDCWLKYPFIYDDNWNDCHGDQYVTMYKQYYVGVILCSKAKYKLFLSESLSDKFLNIADGSGHGQDHCELIGGTPEDSIRLPNDFWDSPSTQGYYRSNWGETIRKGQIGGAPSTNEWTGKYYVKWYECGLNIPGSKQVINYDDTVIFTPEARTTTTQTFTPEARTTTTHIFTPETRTTTTHIFTPETRTTTTQTWENNPTYPVITSEKASSVNIAAIVGIVAGVIVGIAVIIGVTVCVVVLITKQRIKAEQVQTNPSWNGNQNALYSSAQPGQVSWQQHKNPVIPSQPVRHNLPNPQYMNHDSQPVRQNLPDPQYMNQEFAVPVQHISGPPTNYYQTLQVNKPVNSEQLPPMYESLQPESVRYSGQEGIYLEITDDK